jgi:PPM family protein phosphatase
MLQIDYAGDTHVGRKRETNQDSLLLASEEDLFVVADGMGGHLSGEVASQIAIDTIRDFYQDSGDDREITWPFRPDKTEGYHANRLVTSIKLANQRVFETAKSDQQYKGMGTTVVAGYYADGALYLGHVGDSRAYLFRNRELSQITEDHSLLNDFKKNIEMSEEDEQRFPYKNIIVRALGMKDSVEVDLNRMEPEEGDIVLLCSDGLNGELPDKMIQGILQEETNLTRMCARLIDGANERGGKDNITIAIFRFEAGEDLDLMELETEITGELTRDGTEPF